MRKSEAPEELDPAEFMVVVDDVSDRSASAEKGEGAILHSGLSITPAIPSNMAGRSVPDRDWLFLPDRSSNSAVHQPFNIFALRSRSSGRKWVLEGCTA